MPKVNIYATAQPGVNVETGEVVAVTPRRVSIGWSRGQFAQLGVGTKVDPKDSVLAAIDGSGAAIAPDAYLGDVELGEEWKSEWIDLDRQMINQLIRELRKARDEAFGRDE
ncbi:MAG TPA: hypothetical protein VF163_16355 [Micromonosporaceae bacterium]